MLSLRQFLIFIVLITFHWSDVAAKKIYYNPHYLDSMAITKGQKPVLDSLKMNIDPFTLQQKRTKYDLQPTRIASVYSLNDIVFLLFLLLGCFLVLVRSFYPEFFLSTREGLSNPNLFNQRLRDKSLVQLPVLLSILIFKSIIFSLGVTMLFISINKSIEPQLLFIFGKTVIAFFIYGFGKALIEYIVAKISKFEGVYIFHFVQTQMIMGLIAILLLPVLMFYFFYENTNATVFIYIFSGLYIIGQLFNTFRILLTDIIRELKFKLYFFIYLCTLKILPIMILGKYLYDFFWSL